MTRESNKRAIEIDIEVPKESPRDTSEVCLSGSKEKVSSIDSNISEV